MHSVDRERNYFEKIIVYSLQLLNEEKVEKTIKELPLTLKKEVMTAYEALIKKGFEQGLEQGEYKNSIKVILNGHKAGVPIKILALLTNLSEEEVERIIKEHGGDKDA